MITPPGTIVNANPPAPCGGMVEVKYCVETRGDGRARAGSRRQGGGRPQGRRPITATSAGPTRAPATTFIFYEYPAGGTGAFDGGDGSNSVRAWTESDMTTLQPIEAVEQLYPSCVERTALREDSGGPGQWRGGLGLTREVRIQAAGARLSVLAEKAVLPPFGVCGGGAGAHQPLLGPARRSQPSSPRPCPAR